MTLPPRQKQVLEFAARGIKVKEIAYQMGIEHHTVSAHLRTIKKKLAAHTMAHMIAQAVAKGIISFTTE